MEVTNLITGTQPNNGSSPNPQLWAEWEKFQTRKVRFWYDAQTFEEFKEQKKLFDEAQEYLKRILGKDYREPDAR